MTDTTEGTVTSTRAADVDLLNVEAVQHSLRGFASDLRERFDAAVQVVRDERRARLGDAALRTSDIAPLVRSVQGVAEIFTHTGKTLADVGKYAQQVIAEEMAALPAKPIEPGGPPVPRRRVVIGDGQSDIVARIPVTNTTEVDLVKLGAALEAEARIEQAHALREFARMSHPDEKVDEAAVARAVNMYAEGVRYGARAMLAMLSSPKAKSTEVNSRVIKWQRAEQDDLAGLFEAATSKTAKEGDLVVERTEAGKSHRL